MLIGDDTITIFLNAQGTISDVSAEMLEILPYVENTTDAFAATVESDWIKKIHQRVNAVKQSKQMEVEYMTLLQRDREKKEDGVRQMAVLTDLLLSDGRIDDLKRAIKVESYRDKLFEEYDME